MLTLILATSFATLLVFCAGLLAMRWWLRSKTPREQRHGSRSCDFCGRDLPANALRTHTGHWRCQEHKQT